MSSDPPAPESVSNQQPPTSLKHVGKYDIIRQLGLGGMGTVYLAIDRDLKRTVALKVLPKERAENPILVRRFKSEGQAAALLKHENIVSVYEAGEADGYLFLALEFVDGIDLYEWVRVKGPLPVKRSVEVMRQVAAALQHAHERNIVHRDIKPSNLMVSREGAVKLTDMGLARSIDDSLDTSITRDGTTVGTVDYMAPEQASNSKAADIRSDIYSLGCTWYHLLTGSPPYPAGSVTNKLSAHISSPLPDPRQLNEKVPEQVVAVLHRMMAKRKDQRYQTPAELLSDLENETLKRGESAPNLLEMFEDDIDLDDSTELVISLDADSSQETPPSVAQNKTQPVKGKKPAGQPPNALNGQPTRVDLPAKSSKNRVPLARMELAPKPEAPDSKGAIPWGLIVLGLLILVAAVGIWWVVDVWSTPRGSGAEERILQPGENEVAPRLSGERLRDDERSAGAPANHGDPAIDGRG